MGCTGTPWSEGSGSLQGVEEPSPCCCFSGLLEVVSTLVWVEVSGSLLQRILETKQVVMVNWSRFD